MATRTVTVSYNPKSVPSLERALDKLAAATDDARAHYRRAVREQEGSML
jgi:hypothetical protein